jgi:hypothetical protein
LIDRAETAFLTLRRRYRQARIVRAQRRASADARRHGQRVVHMLHVRRTGGTAVHAALNETRIPPDLRLLLHAHGISLAHLPEEDEVFFFLREPVARFVSGFEMRRQEGGSRYHHPWTPGERRAFMRFDSAQDLAMALGSRAHTERAEAEGAMKSIHHLRSHLSDWLVDEAQVRARKTRIMFVGWQERLDADFASLGGLLGLPPTDLPADAYRANRIESDPARRELSAEATSIVRAWYADDYRLIRLLQELGLTRPPSVFDDRLVMM